MTEEHTIYSDEKLHRIDAMCDLFDVFLDVPTKFGSQHYEGYAVDTFEFSSMTEDFDYAHFLKDSILAYLNIYREHNYKAYKELMDRRSKDEISVVSKGKMPMEVLLRDMVPVDKYIPKNDAENYFEAYELGLKTVVNELDKNGDTNVECFTVKFNEFMHDYDGIITGTYFGIVFDVNAFICGKYFFIVVHGSSE